MITKFRMSEANAADEFGMACQRLVPWTADLAEPPFGVMACYLPAGGDSTPDCHDQDEVMIVLSGSGAVDVAGERTSLAAGDVVAIPRNREHVIHNPDGVHNPDGATLSWVSFYWPLHELRGGEPEPRGGEPR